jgi:hypothetical protein
MLVIPALMTVAVGGGCGNGNPKISRGILQQSVTKSLQQAVGQRPEKIECPDELTAEVGESARCVLTDDNARFGLSVTVKSVDNGTAKFDVQVDRTPMRYAR